MRILLALFALFVLSSCNSPKTTTQFYHTHKHKEGVTNFKMPGWLVWIGGGIAQGFVQDPEAKAGLKLARKVKKLRLLATEGYNPITSAEVNSFVNNIRGNGFEDLIMVREGGSTVHILSREKKDKLRNLVILVNDEEEFVFMDMKSRIKYEDLSELVNTVLKSENMKTKEELEEENPPVDSEEDPVVAKKVPRA